MLRHLRALQLKLLQKFRVYSHSNYSRGVSEEVLSEDVLVVVQRGHRRSVRHVLLASEHLLHQRGVEHEQQIRVAQQSSQSDDLAVVSVQLPHDLVQFLNVVMS
jgi:hypothetical protein